MEPIHLMLPEFKRGNHFRDLRGGEYRFETTADVKLMIPWLTWGQHKHRISFLDYRRKEWARIEGDVMTVRAGYAWNGASPCWWVGTQRFGFWMGTPTPDTVTLATLFHDVCCQFLRTHHWPLSETDCNSLFHQIMVQQGFRFPNLYHGAVKDFGKLYLGKYPKRGEISELIS